MSFITATLLPALLAAFLALVAQQVLGPAFLAFREGNKLAAALAAEIEALLTLINERSMVRLLRNFADTMGALHVAEDPATQEHVGFVSVTLDYFEVYSGNVGRLGLLEGLAPDVVTLYTRAKAFVEDMRILHELYRDLVERRFQQANADILRTRYTMAADLLEHCVDHGAVVAQALRLFSQRRFCGLIR